MKIQNAVVFAIISAVCSCTNVNLDIPSDSEIRAADASVLYPEEIVLLASNRTSARRLKQKAIPLGYRIKAEDSLNSLDLVMLTLLVPEGQDGSSAIRELERLEPGVTAGVNHAYVPQAQPSTLGVRSYAKNLLGWSDRGCQSLKRVGVLDTAVDANRRRFITSKDFSRPAGAQEPTDHGDAIIDILQSQGLLSNIDILHADIVSRSDIFDAAASVDTLVLGLDWLISEDADVINISLAGPYNKILDRGLRSAAAQGIIIVAAAGNSGPDSQVLYPAALPTTIAVTAVDARADIYSGGTRGDELDFSAPGVDVYVGDDSEGRYATGTSIAAPFVTLRIAGDHDLQHLRATKDVRAHLAESATDLGPKGFDPVYGHGLISAPPSCRLDKDTG